MSEARVPRWNEIPNLSLQEMEWMDSLAHGTVTPEILKWVCEMVTKAKGQVPAYKAQ